MHHQPRFGPPLRLVAAPFTAFHDDFTLDLDRIPVQLRALRTDGVAGAFICGTSGEGASLDEEERVLVADRWCMNAGTSFDITVHVGHASLGVSCELARHAVSVGARAVAAVAPYYHRPARVEDLVDACAEIADSASPAAFYFYHLPTFTGVQFSMSEFVPMARAHIPTFAGIKFTHNDLDDLGRCTQLAGDDIEIMFGRDEILLPALTLDVKTAVGSTYNFAAPIYAALDRAYRSGDMISARHAQFAARAMIDVAREYGGLPGIKTISSLVGVECGPCRPPLRTPDSSECNQIRDDLKRVGFFDALEHHRSLQQKRNEPNA